MTKLLLYFIYTTYIGSAIRPLINKGFLNQLMGYYCDLGISRVHINSFIKNNNINMDDFVTPESGYENFNDFFSRRLKSNARPIGSSDVVSPADGYLFSIENISTADTFFVKSKKFNLEKFLNDKELANYYQGGTLVIFRLTPPDYHRYHFPVDCRPGSVIRVSGIYESVDPTVYSAGVQPLIENERKLVLLDSKSKIAMISVGALCVGRMVETFKANDLYQKGDEAGYFEFGGSTVAILFKKGTIKIKEKFLKKTEIKVKMGEDIADFRE